MTRVPTVIGAVGLVAVGVFAISCVDRNVTSPSVSFNDDVRPILSDNCFRCHGPDAGTRKAGLRLDVPKGAYGELPESPGKHAVVPHAPEKSELVRRITASNPDDRMPPAQSHKVLTATQIDVLKRWVGEGATYTPHWAYIPPRRTPPAHTEFDDRIVNPIDGYVFDRLHRAGLRPAPEADRETLINRVTLDLTGLPPTLEEVDQFVSDKRADAYERLVDRLLASQRYGERMASAWLDVARYADSDGYLDDLHGRLLWPWRDWVIAAFNRNMPFDQFATWQLAGDLLPNATSEQLLATAFGRLGTRSTENGIIDEEYRVAYMKERTELVGKAFLGLTVGCAQCHDHKYDTISQADYYSLGAFFNSTDERGFYAAGYTKRTVGPTLLWPDSATASKLAEAQKNLTAIEDHAHAAHASAVKSVQTRAVSLQDKPDELQRELDAAIRRATVAYYPFDAVRPATSDEINRYVKVERKVPLPEDGPMQSMGPRGPSLPSGLVEKLINASPSGLPGQPPAFVQEPVLRPGVHGQSVLVTDKNIGFLPQKVGWYDRTQPFGFDVWIRLPASKVFEDATILNHRDHNILTGDSGYTLNLEQNHLRFDLVHMSPHNMISVRTQNVLKPEEWIHVSVMYDGSSRAEGVHIYLNGEPAASETKVDNLSRSILPSLMTGVLGGDFYGFAFGFRFRDELFTGGQIDEIRVYNRALTALEVRAQHDQHSLGVRKPDATAIAEFLVTQDVQVQNAFRSLHDAREAVNELRTGAAEIMVMGDTPMPRQAYLLERGLYSAHGQKVAPRPPTRVFGWNDKLPADRLGLARWLFDPEHPLTARVNVNRLWAMHFGRGIVATADDFGTQGSNPTHPELLDWLAKEFVESGWDIKHLQKLMVMSATYRQSADAQREDLAKDPRNLLLAHFPRTRLPAEMIRDSALAASGILKGEIGGPSVHPYQPGGVWEAVASRHAYPQSDAVSADEHHRRSLYTFVKRSATTPSMVVFDFANRSVSTVSRPLSNTPLQALVLLNDTQYREAYRKMAELALRQAGDARSHVESVFRLATRRHPTQKESDVLMALREVELKRFSASPQHVQEVLHTGVLPIDSSIDPLELASLTSVAAAVMNTPDAYSLR